MFQFTKTGMRVFDKAFKNLVKGGSLSDEVKSLITNEFVRNSSTSLSDSVGTTLLHLAAQCNNVKLIEFLLASGCIVNVQNSFGETPLVSALFSNHWESVEILLNATDFRVDDVERLLRLLIIKNGIKLPSSVPITFMQKLKRYSGDLQTILDILLKVKNDCPLNFIVYAGEARLTQTMLELPDYRFNDFESVQALVYAMETVDLENVRVLWQSDRTAQSTRTTLLSEIGHSIFNLPVDLNWTKPLFEHLTYWIVFDDDFEEFVYKIFSLLGKYNVLVLLQQCDVDVQLREKYNFDVLPILFLNNSFDIKDLTELAFNRRFYVNSPSMGGMSALHYSAQLNSTDKIKLLLKLGADCNIKDADGLTPLCDASDSECIELLLQNGANLQTLDIDKKITVLEMMLSREDDQGTSDTIRVMLAQLAVDYYRGVPIKRTILDGIHKKKMYKDHYENCLEQIEELKSYEILPSLTLFDVITMKVKNLANYVKSRETIIMFMARCPGRYSRSYYYSLMELHLEKAYNIYLTNCRAATIVSENTSTAIGFDHLVVDRICDFLTYADMLALAAA